MAGRRSRGRRRTEVERRNRALCLQLWRARIPLYGRSVTQRYWTSPRGDGKEHRSGSWRRRAAHDAVKNGGAGAALKAGGSRAAIKKRNRQESEVRRESCTCGRGDQIACIVTTGAR